MKGVAKGLQREVVLLNKEGKTAVAPSERTVLDRISKACSQSIYPLRKVNKRVLLTDLWGEGEQLSRAAKKRYAKCINNKPTVIPAVTPAPAALSINPSKEIVEKYMCDVAAAEQLAQEGQNSVQTDEVVPSAANCEEAKSDGFELPVRKVVKTLKKTQAQRNRERRHKLLMHEHAARRKEKESRKASELATRLAKERESLLSERQKMRMKTTVSRILQEASGKASLTHGAGGRFVEPPAEVPLGDSSAGCLRRIVPTGNVVKERVNSILRRRLVEQVPEANAEYIEKLRFSKLAHQKGSKLVDRDARERCVLLS